MSVSDLSWRKACLSSLLHDLRVAYSCLRYNALNPFNFYSLKVRDDLLRLSDAVHRLYVDCSDPSFSSLNSCHD